MKMITTAAVTVALFVSFAGATARAAMTPNFTAKIYDLKDRSKQMFAQTSEFEITDGRKTVVSTVRDMTGSVLVIDTTVLSSDGKLISFEQDQKQVKTLGKLELKEGRVFFTFTKGEKTKTDDESADSGFIVSSTLVAYVQANWDRLMKGETVKARLGVLDRLETVGFQFQKETTKDVSGTPGVILKMKASSLFISAIVNPLYFAFPLDGKHLLELEGRTSVKVGTEGNYKDFDGYTVYTYPEQSPAATDKAAPKD